MLVNNLLEPEHVYEISWDANTFLWQRNLPGNTKDSPYWFLRLIAGENKSLKVLEVIRGLPFKALDLQRPENFRQRGDMLIHHPTLGNHEAPNIEAYWVSDEDWVKSAAKSEGRNAYDFKNMLRWMLAAKSEKTLDILSAYEERCHAGFIHSAFSQSWADSVANMAAKAGGFDLAFVDLSEYVDRVSVLSAVQKSLNSGGRGFMLLENWRAFRNVVGELNMIQDVVRLSNGTFVDLGEYLNSKPGYTSVKFPGAKLLIIEPGTGVRLTIDNFEEVERTVGAEGRPYYQQSTVKVIWREV